MFRGIIAGVIAGSVLGLLLKGMEKATGIPVYALLLNVDFIPYFQAHPLHEAIEFLLHLFVSVIIGMVYFFIVTSQKVSSYKKAFQLSFILTLPAILLYFPLSILAVDRLVPEPFDLLGIGLWVVSHLVYCMTLTVFIEKNGKNIPLK